MVWLTGPLRTDTHTQTDRHTSNENSISAIHFVHSVETITTKRTHIMMALISTSFTCIQTLKISSNSHRRTSTRWCVMNLFQPQRDWTRCCIWPSCGWDVTVVTPGTRPSINSASCNSQQLHFHYSIHTLHARFCLTSPFLSELPQARRPSSLPPRLRDADLPYSRFWWSPDIFVWIVGPRHSANYFNCALCCLTYLLSVAQPTALKHWRTSN